jgi:hypothetical protein
MQIKHYLQQALDGFKHDPADSDFQRGYLAALEEVAKMYAPEIIDAPDNKTRH